MAKFVGARVYNSANISVNDSTDTALTFNTETFDTDTIHSTSVNTGRLTCFTAGKYLISATVVYAFHATGYRQTYIRLNGTTVLGIDSRQAITSNTLATRVTVSTLYPLAATDYLEVIVAQTSGGALNVLNEGTYSPSFMMHRVG